MSTDPSLVDVQILGFPLDIQQVSNAWHDELLREFALVALSHDDGAEVSRHLLELVERTRSNYSEFTTDVESSQMEMHSAGAARGDFLYRVPATIADACAELDVALDRSEEFCASGNLLTMQPPAVVSAFRRWLLREFVGQIRRGAQPTSWDTYVAQHGHASV
ncbi:MAG: hypothetical protein JWM93_1546 [Frankiales bacterium]|nr:hypothetical protein [Frankiales bacterium]